MNNLNAKEVLKKFYDENKVSDKMSISERKLYESVIKSPGISRDVIGVTTGLGNSESTRALFSLAKKGMVHIVENDKVFPI